MKNMKKIIYALAISFGICFTSLEAAAQPGFMALIDLFIQACRADDAARAITLYNQDKGSFIIIKGKKISQKAIFCSAMDLDTQTNGLMYAVHHENMSLIRFFLENLNDVKKEINYHPVDWKNHTGCTALHIAARKGNKEIVGLLLQNGASLNLVDMVSMTALHGAAIGNHPEIVTILLEVGIDASIRDSVKKMTAKDMAIVFKHEAVIQAFEAYENKK